MQDQFEETIHTNASSNTSPSDILSLSISGNISTSAAASASTSTMTITRTNQNAGTLTSTDEQEILPLTLRARPTVTWDADVEDNEGLGRKSSKRCCIFHKPRAFGESSTDSSDNDSDCSGSSSSSGGGFPSDRSRIIANNRRVIARPKNKNTKKVPDYQRFHA